MDNLISILDKENLILNKTESNQDTIHYFKWDVKNEKESLLYIFFVVDNSLLITYIYLSKEIVGLVEKDILDAILLMHEKEVQTITIKFLSIFYFITKSISKPCFLCYCHQLGFLVCNETKKKMDIFPLYDNSCCVLCFIKNHSIENFSSNIISQ